MLNIRQIKEDEIDVFIEFLKCIAIWLNEMNRGMWNVAKLSRVEFLCSNNYNECYFGFLDDIPVASIILKEQYDFMWQNEEKVNALYIGKLGVSREYSGRGYARVMLDYANMMAQRKGKQYLRLDCYADRKNLCKLYEDYGFKLIKMREMKPNLYAALYELEV